MAQDSTIKLPFELSYVEFPKDNMATSISLGKRAPPEDQAPTGFLSLPPEIRLIIYDIVLTSQKDERASGPIYDAPMVLRRRIEVVRPSSDPSRPWPLVFYEISLLLVNRLLTAEALPRFYATNNFHISLPSYHTPLPSTIFPLHLPLIHHLSLDYVYRPITIRNSRKPPFHHIPDIDTTLCIHLSTVSFACAKLRTFNLSILYKHVSGFHPVHEWLRPPSRTALLLAQLRVRDWISMKVTGDGNGFEELRAVVGERKNWKGMKHGFCPGVGPSREWADLDDMRLMRMLTLWCVHEFN